MYKIINILIIIFFVTSCKSMQSAKKTLTGEKEYTTDEFLVQKKNPLILPPDYENLPDPDERDINLEEESIFQNTLETEGDEGSAGKTSVESSILKKIQSK